MVQGTSSSSGKTVLVTALCRIFKNFGYDVAPFKSQNMSNFVYRLDKLEISVAQTVQAIAAKTEITTDINPILLKPIGHNRISVFVKGKLYKDMHITDYYKNFIKKGFRIAVDSLHNLQKNHDLIIIEGAGSPVEINIQKFDIANMKIAEHVKSPVILITDIDRGGSFASIVGTVNLLNKSHKSLVKGFIFNRFRGDENILKSGFKKLKQKTGKPVLGIIPKFNFLLPEEDSLGNVYNNTILNNQNMKNIDYVIEKMSKLIQNRIDIKVIKDLIC